ncbi:hypothetical protein SB85_09280 [Xanthomonas sacchari]|nr:hypothetical protein SB85_09280 [Xanthomonas sacchari]
MLSAFSQQPPARQAPTRRFSPPDIGCATFGVHGGSRRALGGHPLELALSRCWRRGGRIVQGASSVHLASALATTLGAFTSAHSARTPLASAACALQPPFPRPSPRPTLRAPGLVPASQLRSCARATADLRCRGLAGRARP